MLGTWYTRPSLDAARAWTRPIGASHSLPAGLWESLVLSPTLLPCFRPLPQYLQYPPISEGATPCNSKPSFLFDVGSE